MAKFAKARTRNDIVTYTKTIKSNSTVRIVSFDDNDRFLIKHRNLFIYVSAAQLIL